MLRNKLVQVVLAFGLGAAVLLLPRPEGTTFDVVGDADRAVLAVGGGTFTHVEDLKRGGYRVRVLDPAATPEPGERLRRAAADAGLQEAMVRPVDRLSPTAFRFLAVLVTPLFLFIVEPIPLEITAVLIGVLPVATGVTDVASTWATFMHPRWSWSPGSPRACTASTTRSSTRR